MNTGPVEAFDELLEAYSALLATRRRLVNLLSALPKGDRSTTTTPDTP